MAKRQDTRERGRRISPATDFAYERIRAGILNGEFPPAGRLKEKELVRICGVSRTPVREALGRLAAEDYVIVTRNQGAQVKTWSDEDMADLIDLRALLEGHAAARAAQRIQSDCLGLLQDNIEEMERVLASRASHERKTETFLRLNRHLHETVWSASGSERLQSLLGRLVKQALVVRTAHRFTLDRIERSHRHHRELVDALAHGDPIWAEAVMRGHIRAALVFMHKYPIEASPDGEKCIQSAV